MRPARAPIQPVRGQRGRRGGPRGRNDRALEDGEGVPSVVTIEHEHGRCPREASLDVARITGDPLEPRHAEAVSEVGRQRDDPAIGLLGKPEEVAVRVHGLPARVREIRVPYDVYAVGPMAADDVKHGLTVDNRQLEVHSRYSSFAAQVGSNTESR